MIPVDGKGRIEPHYVTGRPMDDRWSGCPRSLHPSREELTRRKSRREAARAELVERLKPEALAALDAYELRGSDAGEPHAHLVTPERLAEFRRVALYEWNREHQTRHRTLRDSAPGTMMGLCRFCRGDLDEHDGADGAIDHLTLCSLLYLAGLPGEQPTKGT